MTLAARPFFPMALSLGLALGFLASSCSGPGKAAADSPNPKLKTAMIRVGGQAVEVELARTELERERGLMFRLSLADGKGMLFIFEKDDHHSFWMKNTKIPLALAYIASDGTIRQIEELVPESLEAVRSERSVRYVLEAPSHWFERAGVKVGDKVDLGAIAQLD